MGVIENERVMRRLYRISTEYERGFAHQVRSLLEVGCERLGLEIGILSQIQGDRFVLEYLRAPDGANLAEGEELPLHQTLAEAALEADGPVCIKDLADSAYRDHHARLKWGLGAYLGVPVRVEGEIYGTLSFSSLQKCHECCTPPELDMVDLMASWLGVEIQRARSEARLKQADENFRLGMEASPAAMIMVDGSGGITYANASALELFGYDFGDLLGTRIEALVPEAVRQSHQAQREAFAREGGNRPMGKGRVLDGRHRSGRLIPMEVSLKTIPTPYGAFTLCTILDMTQRLQFEEKLQAQQKMLEEANRDLASQALTDGLTGLLNRRALYSHLESLLRLVRRQKTTVSLLFLDLDHFKVLNDTAGHQAGDVALQRVARVLKEAARRSDIAARYGGEEFVLVLPEAPGEGAVELAERIREQVAGLTELALPVTISIGVATVTGPDQDAEAALLAQRLVDQADRALYRAKHTGRNRVVHYRDL